MWTWGMCLWHSRGGGAGGRAAVSPCLSVERWDFTLTEDLSAQAFTRLLTKLLMSPSLCAVSLWQPRTNIIHAPSKQRSVLINNKANSGRHCSVIHSQHVRIKDTERHLSSCKALKRIEQPTLKITFFSVKDKLWSCKMCEMCIRGLKGHSVVLEKKFKLKILIFTILMRL